MGRIIRLTERDLTRIVKRVIREDNEKPSWLKRTFNPSAVRRDESIKELKKQADDDFKNTGECQYVVAGTWGMFVTSKKPNGTLKPENYRPSYYQDEDDDDMMYGRSSKVTNYIYTNCGSEDENYDNDDDTITERDLTRIVKRVIREEEENYSDDDKLKGYMKTARSQSSTAYTYILMKNIFKKYKYFIINWDNHSSGNGPVYIVDNIEGGEKVSMEEMKDEDTFKEVSNYYYSYIKDDMNSELTNTDEKKLYDHIINGYDGKSFPDWNPENMRGIFDLYSDDDQNPISERYFRKRRY